MSSHLWTLRIFGPRQQLELAEEAFIYEALALSSLEAQENRPAHIEAIFDVEPLAKGVKDKLAPISETLRFEIVTIDNLDWIRKVCADLAPLPIARWTIFGSAFRDQISAQTLGIQIEATSAFGTGEHPTTRGCLIMLDRLLKKHHRTDAWRMLDMGCGSGILAMAFASATGGHALGIDMDDQSVEIAKENLKNNNLTKLVRIEHGTGYANPVIAQSAPYDLVMANVFARPLCEMAKDLSGSLRHGGFAILSGILNKQEKAVLAAHRQQGLCLLHRMRIGEWSILALRRPFRQS